MTRIQSFLTSAALAATLSACGSEAAIEGPEDGTPVTMDWSKGETFYLATSYRRTAVKTEENPVNMAAAFDGTAIPTFGESWTEDIIWTYQVVESNFVPSADDELFRFAATDTGVEALAVIKASLDEVLNADAAMLEADPVVYMVFREDRDRMVGLVTFVNVDASGAKVAIDA